MSSCRPTAACGSACRRFSVFEKRYTTVRFRHEQTRPLCSPVTNVLTRRYEVRASAFLPAQWCAYISAVFAIEWCLSVCLSVTIWYRVDTSRPPTHIMAKIFHRQAALSFIRSVFFRNQIAFRNSDETPSLNIGLGWKRFVTNERVDACETNRAGLLNTVWHRMIYSKIATVGIKGLSSGLYTAPKVVNSLEFHVIGRMCVSRLCYSISSISWLMQFSAPIQHFYIECDAKIVFCIDDNSALSHSHL